MATEQQQLEINVSGEYSINLPAERAVLEVKVYMETTKNKHKATDSVVASSRKVESILRDNSKAINGKEPSIDYWSRDSLHESHYTMSRTEKEPNPPTEYRARVNFDMHLKTFSKLGPLIHELCAIDHVSSQGVKWILTQPTQDAQRSHLRLKAAQDARKKADEYAAAMEYSKVWAVEVRESAAIARSSNRKTGAFVQREDVTGTSKNMAGEDWEDVSEESFQYSPEDITMMQTVNVKFLAV